MVTRLFLHSSTSSVSGTLPNSEQSSLTADDTFEGSDSTNRSMSRKKGTSETSLVNTSIATTSQKIYYTSRWVSDPINQSGIAANTWTYGFGATTVSSANYPSRLSQADVWVNIYVWRPTGGGSVVGTIVDTSITATASGGTGKREWVRTVSGSAVAGAAAGDVIVFEAWNKITQAAASALDQTFWFDGTTAPATNAASSSISMASFIETPEDISLSDGFVTTKLYLHNTTSGIPSGTLPSAEQSTKTVSATCNAEGSQTTNRLMNSTIGTSQASLTITTPTSGSPFVFYFSRWVSPVIYQTSIDAGAWTYNFAARESSTSANFPVSANNKAVWVNCYVWKPSNGTNYGTILDGNTAATVSEGTASQERSQEAEFTGAAVSSLTSGDACIVFEVWFDITASVVAGVTNDFFYDGTTETAAGSTVSNHASLISFFGTAINFTAGGTLFTRALSTETISVSESIARLYASNRAPTAETITVGESQTRLLAASRALSTETIIIGESQSRIYGANRAPTTETNTIGENLARLYSANRALSDTSAISEAIAKVQVLVRSLSDTTAISESLVRTFGVIKNLSDTTAISESIARLFTGTRALSAETTTVGESLARLKAANRTLTDTTTISESLARTFGVTRTLSETTVIGESLSRVLGAIRALSDTTAISESLAKIQTLVRSLSDTTAISESLSRILGINRSLIETTVIGESLTRVLGAIRALATQTTTIGESLTRVFGAVRSLSDTTTISESLTRLLGLVRSLSDTTIITGIVDSLYSSGAVGNFVRALATETVSVSETLVRSISNARSLLTETTVIGESLNRILGAVRSLTETTIISESLSRLQSLTRTLTNTTTLSESLARVYGAIRNLTNTTTISESLNRLVALTRSLSDTTVISEILSRIQGLTRTLTDTTAITESLTRVYGVVKSLSDTIPISDSITRLTNMVRSLTQSVIILESLVRTIIREITDYVPSLETDFKDDIDKMVLPYIFNKWNATGQLQKGTNMIDASSPVEFKVGIHSSRPYQILALEQQTEINKISINKFSGGVWQFHTIVEITVMVQRLQRDIPIELSQMEKEIQRIVCHYRRDEIVGIDDLILVGMRREWTGSNRDWSKSIWSTKIYLKAQYTKVNVENM